MEVPGREGREDAVRGYRARLPPHRVGYVFVALDRVLVVEIDERGACECAHDLGGDVQRHLCPREPTAHRQRDRDRRVDVRAADPSRDVDPEHDRHAPSPGDQQPVARRQEDRVVGRRTTRLVQRGDGHRDHAVTEGDQDERAEILREELPPDRLPPGSTGAHANVPDPRHSSGLCCCFRHLHLPLSNFRFSEGPLERRVDRRSRSLHVCGGQRPPSSGSVQRCD